MRRALIAGCGYVGTATADLLHAADWDVEGWTHSPESAAQLATKPYPVRAVDLAVREVVRAARGEFDLVIHCASSGGGGAGRYRQVYLEGAGNLLSGLQPGELIFTSSTSVYAQTEAEWVNEESAAEPTHESGKILRATEELVRQNGGLIARLAGIYGPGRSALLRKFLSGAARIEGDGRRILNQIHRDDVASALLLLANLPNEKRSGQIFNVVDDEPITQRACYEWLAEKLGRPLPPTASAPAARRRGASNKRVSNRKLHELGWVLKYPSFAFGLEKSVLPAADDCLPDS
jgi:nucleoside-diphosphate-sugar epimerase